MDKLTTMKAEEIEAIKKAVANATNLQWLPLEKIQEIKKYLDSVSYGAVKPFTF